MSSVEIEFFEFCPVRSGAFGPWTERGRGYLTTREHALRLFARWTRRFGPGELYATPVNQRALVVKATRAERVA